MLSVLARFSIWHRYVPTSMWHPAGRGICCWCLTCAVVLVVAVDLAYGRGRGRNIEGGEAFRAQFAAALLQPERCLTAMDVWRMHVLFRGVLVADPAEADLGI